MSDLKNDAIKAKINLVITALHCLDDIEDEKICPAVIAKNAIETINFLQKDSERLNFLIENNYFVDKVGFTFKVRDLRGDTISVKDTAIGAIDTAMELSK